MLNENKYKNSVASVAASVMLEEDNCEDAVNGIAYEAYQAMNGETPMYLMDVDEMDRLLGEARAYVKANCDGYGFEWEEF